MAMMRMSQSFIRDISASWKKKYGHTGLEPMIYRTRGEYANRLHHR
jgi:hypothetical protein